MFPEETRFIKPVRFYKLLSVARLLVTNDVQSEQLQRPMKAVLPSRFAAAHIGKNLNHLHKHPVPDAGVRCVVTHGV